MGQAKAIEGFQDIRSLMDRAAQEENGIKILCPDRGTAVSLRGRAYALRTRAQDKSKQLFEPTEQGYGRSPYDAFILRLRELPGRPKGSQEWELLIIPSGSEMALSGLKIEAIKTGEL